MDDERAGADAGADEQCHLRPLAYERASRPALEPRLTVGHHERSVGDPDARKIERRAEVQGEAGAAGVVATGGVGDHDLG